uniref:Uncharacterized protein n=1 Tax=Bracon brevicornis TaxID=1563983 RepID=A0A6V7LZF7_9HYME
MTSGDEPMVDDREEEEAKSAENDSDENVFSDLDEDEISEDIAELMADANGQLQPQKSKVLYMLLTKNSLNERISIV